MEDCSDKLLIFWAQFIESCSLPKQICLFPSEMIKLPLRDLSHASRADNEPNQLENSSRLDSTIESLNLVHEPNESNLS